MTDAPPSPTPTPPVTDYSTHTETQMPVPSSNDEYLRWLDRQTASNRSIKTKGQ